jgi:hypothetical protein
MGVQNRGRETPFRLRNGIVYFIPEAERRQGRASNYWDSAGDWKGGPPERGPTERNARSGGIRALHFSAEKRKEGRGMHPSAMAGVFAAPAVKL